jgi:outer membrane protein assembly factor BamB
MCWLCLVIVAVACGDDNGSGVAARQTGNTATQANAGQTTGGTSATAQTVNDPGARRAESPPSTVSQSGASGAVPAEMCAAPAKPALAAYDRKTGTHKWSVCASDSARRELLAASDKFVYLTVSDRGPAKLVAYDMAGKEVPDGGPAEGRPELPTFPTGPHEGIIVGAIRVTGGQDDPTTVVDHATGRFLWSQPGSPPYDDVWAIGDDAVYVIDRNGASSPRLVAYELSSGKTRWQIDNVDPYGTIGWPWHVDGDLLFTIWSNLAVFSTRDGKTVWQTNYPKVEFPRMTGVRANSTLVFVAFSSIASGGD